MIRKGNTPEKAQVNFFFCVSYLTLKSWPRIGEKCHKQPFPKRLFAPYRRKCEFSMTRSHICSQSGIIRKSADFLIALFQATWRHQKLLLLFTSNTMLECQAIASQANRTHNLPLYCHFKSNQKFFTLRIFLVLTDTKFIILKGNILCFHCPSLLNTNLCKLFKNTCPSYII